MSTPGPHSILPLAHEHAIWQGPTRTSHPRRRAMLSMQFLETAVKTVKCCKSVCQGPRTRHPRQRAMRTIQLLETVRSCKGLVSLLERIARPSCHIAFDCWEYLCPLTLISSPLHHIRLQHGKAAALIQQTFRRREQVHRPYVAHFPRFVRRQP